MLPPITNCLIIKLVYGILMEYAKIQVSVPKEIQAYFADDYAVYKDDELKRNALLLYP